MLSKIDNQASLPKQGRKQVKPKKLQQYYEERTPRSFLEVFCWPFLSCSDVLTCPNLPMKQEAECPMTKLLSRRDSGQMAALGKFLKATGKQEMLSAKWSPIRTSTQRREGQFRSFQWVNM